jgi:anaerobic selenocysteine-containing dehydrogenase
VDIGRREFVAGLGGLGVGIGLGGVSHWLPLAPPEIGPDWAPGREELVPSTCLLCPSHCGIRGRVVDGRLVRVEGNPLHPISQGGLCAKGYAGIQLLYHPARLQGPMERTGPPGSDEFRSITWSEALERVGATLAELRGRVDAGPLAFLTGHVSGVMEEILERFAAAYGDAHLLREGYDDGSAEVLELMQGIRAAPAFDLEGSDFVLSFGAALSEAWWSLPLAARARQTDGRPRPRFVQVDVRHSRTAARADEWVPVRPGTCGALALGIISVLLKEGLYAAQGIHERVEGLEDWRDEAGQTVPGLRSLVLRHGRTEEISERTGVPPETLVRLAKAFGSAERPVAVWDQAVSWRSGGLADALAIHTLNVLVGALNRPGGVLIQPPPPRSASGEDTPRSAQGRPRGPLTSADWATRAASDEGVLEALFLYYANPVASASDPATVKQALERIPLVVSFSPFLDESARFAHLVLPDHTYLERWQDAPAPASVPIRVWGVVQPMQPPLHDTRATGDVLLELAARLGGEIEGALHWPSVEALVTERGQALCEAPMGSWMLPAFRREELREIEARGWRVPHGLSPDEYWDSLRQAGGWFDPYYDYHDRSTVSGHRNGKVRVFPPGARERIRESQPGLVAGFLPLVEGPGATEDGEDQLLRLVPYRVMTLASGGTPLMPWLLENLGILTADAWETWAEINPQTGRELGLRSGQRVRITSEAGEFVARLIFFAGAQPGVVNVPYGLHAPVDGWGRPDGANPLRAVGNRRDATTGLPDWYSTWVRVMPA